LREVDSIKRRIYSLSLMTVCISKSSRQLNTNWWVVDHLHRYPAICEPSAYPHGKQRERLPRDGKPLASADCEIQAGALT
jgi:hypothetical protein